jgi:hypothetical protein
MSSAPLALEPVASTPAASVQWRISTRAISLLTAASLLLAW